MIQKRKRYSQANATKLQSKCDDCGRNRKMAQDSFPLDISRSLGNLISTAVERVASEVGLQSESWYHDEPRWLVWLEAANGIVREVQIAAFRGKSDDELCFIPHAYSFDGDQLHSTAERPTSRKVLRLSLSALQSNRSDTSDNIVKQLRLAWTNALSFKDSDLIPTKKK